MVSDQAKTEKLNLSVDFAEEIKGQTKKDLESLRDQLAKDLAGDLTRLVVLCRNNKIKYQQWTEGQLDDKKREEVRSVLGQTPSGKKLCDALESGDSAHEKGAEQILAKIVGLMKTQESKVQEFKAEKQDLSENVVSDLFEDAGANLKKTIANHPWQSAAALVASVMVVNFLANHEKFGEPLRAAAAVGVLAWTANFFTGAMTGKSAVDRIVDWSREEADLGEHMNNFFDKFEGNDKIDATTLRTAFTLGSIPFNVFLKQYELARDSGSNEIDMAALKRRASGLGIENDAFKQEHGAELFALMEHFADNARYKRKTGLDALKAQYGDEADGDKPFTFWQVVMIEELDDPDGIRPKEDTDSSEESTRKTSSDSSEKRGAVAAAGAAAKEASERSSAEAHEVGYEDYQTELLTVLALQSSRLVLEKPTAESNGVASGKGTLMGFELQYERTEDGDGDVQYQLKIEGATQYLSLGEGFDRQKQEDKATALKEHLRGKMQERIKAQPVLSGLNEKTVRWSEERWILPYNFTSSAPFLRTQPKSTPLEVRPNASGTADVFLFGDRLDSTQPISRFVETRATAHLIRRDIPAFRDIPEGDLRIDSVKVPVNTTQPTVVKGSVMGGSIELKWDPSDKKFEVTHFELSPAFIEGKLAAAGADPRLNQIFLDLEGQGESFSTWWRGALDLATIQMPDHEDHQWKGLIGFKRDELLRLYEGRLRDLSPADPEILTKVQQAYDETIGGAIRTFESYPGKLGEAQLRQDQASYDRMEHEILTFGWSSSYEGAYQGFLALVGPTNINLPAYNEDSNPKQAEVLGFLVGQWSRLTADIAHVDFPAVQGNIYYDYCQKVQQGIAGVVFMALKEATSASTRGYIWENFVKNGVGIEELQKYESEFSKIPKWEDYQRNYLRSPETEGFMHGQRPELKGQAGNWEMVPVPGNPNQFKIIWYRGTAAEFEAIMEVNPSTRVLEYRNLELSEPWIDQHVDAIASAPEFNQPYEDLMKRFDGLEVRANGYFPGVWEYFNGIEHGAWKAAARFKRQEALDAYRSSLKALLHQGLSPQAAAQAFGALYASFTDRYMKDVHKLDERVATDVRQFTSDETPYLTEQEFTAFMSRLEVLGYGDRYLALMDGARRTLEAFPYVGFDHPSQGANALLLLVNKKTSFMNKTTPTPQEEAYFKAVVQAAEKVARTAYANQNGTGNFARASIGPDEIPVTLPIEDYAQWLPLHPHAGTSTLPPPSATPAAPEALTEAAQLRDRLNGLYKTLWADKVYTSPGVVRDGIDDENVEELEPKIKEQLEGVFKSILYTSNAQEKERLIAEFTRYLNESFEAAEAGWWEFWE